MKQRLRVVLCLMLAAFVALPTVAFADEPRMEVRSSQSRCDQPWEITATGLEPSKPVLVAFTFGGTASAGAVGGNSDATGRFFSPIPKVFLPCVEGGKVTASITVAGKLLPITAQFEIAAPGAQPAAPAAGNSPETREGSNPRWGLFALGVGVVLFASGSAVSLRKRRRAV